MQAYQGGLAEVRLGQLAPPAQLVLLERQDRQDQQEVLGLQAQLVQLEQLARRVRLDRKATALARYTNSIQQRAAILDRGITSTTILLSQVLPK